MVSQRFSLVTNHLLNLFIILISSPVSVKNSNPSVILERTLSEYCSFILSGAKLVDTTVGLRLLY